MAASSAPTNMRATSAMPACTFNAPNRSQRREWNASINRIWIVLRAIADLPAFSAASAYLEILDLYAS
jgi:hypothetical protein